MKKLLAFLGTGNYSPVTYVWGSREYKTNLFPEALAIWLDPSEMLVFLTAEAEQHENWKTLQARLRDKLLLKPIRIPSGKSETELWEIFEALTGQLRKGDEVNFDVTHAFRSLPILVLLAAAYLRVAQSVGLKRVLYGAFEAKDQNTNRAPVFDLTPFLDLLDWVTATDQFLKTGNGQALANVLREKDSSVTSLADNIDAIAQGLHLLRPMDVIKMAAELPSQIAMAAARISESVPPFATLMNRVEKDYSAFGLTNPTNHAANAKPTLVRQLRMVEWYFEKGQIVHALSLAREWLPSLLCYHFGLDPIDKASRDDMELLLRGGIDKDSRGHVIKQSPRLAQWATVPQGKKIRSLWTTPHQLANLRNDVLHAGFRKDPKGIDIIRQETGRLITELKTIAITWGLEDDTDDSSQLLPPTHSSATCRD